MSLKAQHARHEERGKKGLGKEIFLSFILPLRYCRSWLFMGPLHVSPPKWQRKGIRGHGNELCTSPARGVKRANFWNDGCRRWCPICFSSLEFTASAALCKQLGSKTGCSAISSSPFHFPPPSYLYARSAMSLREHHFRFLLRNTVVLCLLFGCQYCSFYLCIYHRWQSTVVVLNVYRGGILSWISRQGLRMLLWAGV